MSALRKPAQGKLRSSRGASLTMALLLFLVCAVMGSVVLAAGTAAAGRASQRAAMDQRYYAVASAAELLARELDGRTVTVVREKTTVTTAEKEFSVVRDPETGAEIVTPVNRSAPGPVDTFATRVKAAAPGEEDTVLRNDLTGSSVSTEDLSFLTARVVKLLFGSRPCGNDAAMEYSFPSGASEPETELKLQPSLGAGVSGISGEALSVLSVTCKYELKSDGTLVFRLSDQLDSDDCYTLILTLQPSVSQEDRTVKTGGQQPTVEMTSTGYKETFTSTVIRTVTSTVTWSVTGME